MKINKGQFRLSSRSNNLKFDINRGKGHLFSYIKNRIQWHLYPRIQKVSDFPLHVDVEISSACDLNCPMCYTTTEEFKNKVGSGFMDFELFKKIIDECVKKNLFSIRISFRGEPFIHPKVFEMIKYAKEKGIKEVSTLTHGGRLDEKKFGELVDLGLDWLTISFDGIGETYEKIRFPLKFDDAVQKIGNYQKIKKEKKSVKPVIKVQTVWPAVSENPKEYFDIFNKITDQVAANPLIDYLGNDSDIEYEENFVCPQLWERLVIGSDGEALLCSNDEMGSYKIGNANKESLHSIWHGKKMNKARELHIKHMGVDKVSPCKYCYLPRKTSEEQTTLDNRLLKIDNYKNREQTVGK
jgi:radical SAM protein with 4Fe4S-binding SPASM domain